MARSAKRLILRVLVLAAAAVVAAVAGLEWRFLSGRKAADQAWETGRPDKLPDIGGTRTLAILPLVDWSVARPELSGEPGVAYLIRTDHGTILFDVGVNLDKRDPSPLIDNMRRLGVGLADIDTVVLSHNHLDHVGGLKFARSGTFSLGPEQLDLRGKRVFVPVPMTYPGVTPTVSREPVVIAPGVATTGTIAGQLYMGRVDEQALAIRVQDKGIVLIVGCGHQSLPRLLARSAQLFDEPVYGVIGGLHYPVPRGRLTTAGLDMQKLVAFGPFHAPSEADVERDVALLASARPQWVSLSPHDSSDESIAIFRGAFGPRYHDLRVGDWQVVAGTVPALAQVRQP